MIAPGKTVIPPPRAMLAPLLAAALLLPALATPARAQAPETKLEQARRAYDRGAYKQVIELLKPLLYPTIKLGSESALLRAHKLLGVSYVFEKDRNSAQKEFLAILSLRPDYQLDPLVDPEAAVEVFEEVKRDNAERLKRVRDRIDAERRRQREAERRRGRVETVLEVSRTRRSYWVNYVPFGAGQFQNGHRIKGWVLAGLQAALGGVSLGSAIAVRSSYSGTIVAGSSEETDAKRLITLQVVSGGLFFAAVAYGIIDALVYHKPETVQERRYQRKVVVAPSIGPDVAGLSLGLGF